MVGEVLDGGEEGGRGEGALQSGWDSCKVAGMACVARGYASAREKTTSVGKKLQIIFFCKINVAKEKCV